MPFIENKIFVTIIKNVYNVTLYPALKRIL